MKGTEMKGTEMNKKEIGEDRYIKTVDKFIKLYGNMLNAEIEEEEEEEKASFNVKAIDDFAKACRFISNM